MRRKAERTDVSLRSYDGRERAHAHDFAQIVLPLAGAMDMRVAGAHGRIADGQGVLVPPGVPHSFVATGANRFVVLDRPPLSDAAGRPDAGPPFFAVDAALDGLTRYLAAEAAAGPLDAAVTAHAGALLALALQRRAAGHGAPDPVARAIALMRRRRAEPLTVAEIAAAAGLAPSRFHERFRRDTGITPARYLARLRLDLAEELLRAGGMPIAEVALAAGFSDQSALTRCLRRHRGVTPAALRRG